ncbi:MAG: alpha/beta fold hydrolase [Candidatus Odinarchaeota archaeon]
MPYVTVNDIKIYYEIHGPSDGPPLICINGWGDAIWSWFLQINTFKQQYKCILFDNRGAGKSSKPDYPYTMEMFVDDAAGLLEALNIPKAHVIGISMGGFIAQQLAVTYPEKIKSLVLISSHFGGTNHIPIPDDVLARMFAAPTETISKDQAFAIRRSVAYSPRFLEENKQLIKQIQVWQETNPTPLYALAHQTSATYNYGLNGVENKLSKITAPTLVICGENDRIVIPKNSEMIAERIPTSRLVMLKDGPHRITVEQHEKFNGVVMDFLDDVEKGTFRLESEKIIV